MRCKACDDVLSDGEARAKTSYGGYEEMCSRCLGIVSADLNDDDILPVNLELNELFDETQQGEADER